MTKSIASFCLIIFIHLFFSCNPKIESSNLPLDISHSGWQAVYKHGKDGTPISGSIDSLIAGIRNGYDLRVGWGVFVEREDTTIVIEHMATPLFLTIIQEKDVSVVIDAHPILKSYWRIEEQEFREGGDIWQCVLNTKGVFNAQVYSRTTGELINDWPQRKIMTWFVDYPAKRIPHNIPLYK